MLLIKFSDAPLIPGPYQGMSKAMVSAWDHPQPGRIGIGIGVNGL